MSDADPRIGAWITPKYRIDRAIGRGGMATVYAGRHRNGNRVAIKLLHAEISRDAEVRARFIQEGYAANAVEHPGVVRVLDDDVTADGAAFVVMELLEGTTLEAMREASGGWLSAAVVLSAVHQLLDVLEAAHQRGVIHRDIKPDNLFISRDGALRILDFGIARFRDANASSATKTGIAMGTPPFMPREQILGKTREIDGRTDIYAVGATMFTCLTGEYVYEAETVSELAVKAATQPARSLAVVMPGAHPALVALIDRALPGDRSARWPSAWHMREALGQACVAATGHPPSREVLAAMVARLVPATVSGPGALRGSRPDITPPPGPAVAVSPLRPTTGSRSELQAFGNEATMALASPLRPPSRSGISYPQPEPRPSGLPQTGESPVVPGGSQPGFVSALPITATTGRGSVSLDTAKSGPRAGVVMALAVGVVAVVVGVGAVVAWRVVLPRMRPAAAPLVSSVTIVPPPPVASSTVTAHVPQTTATLSARPPIGRFVPPPATTTVRAPVVEAGKPIATVEPEPPVPTVTVTHAPKPPIKPPTDFDDDRR